MEQLRVDRLVRADDLPAESTSWHPSQGDLPAVLWETFLHFAAQGTPRTELFGLSVRRGGVTLGVAPVVRLGRRASTDTLRPAVRRWLAPWLGPLTRKTTYLLDTAFLAFAYADPILARPGEHERVCTAAIEHLKSLPDCDAIWIATPPGDESWARRHRFFSFSILPLVQVRWIPEDDWNAFLGREGKKRRRNARVDSEAFTAGGGRVERLESPFPPTLLDAMHACLRASESRSELHVPYNDVLIGPGFRTQRQSAWCAWSGADLAGFLSFVDAGTGRYQCHGGFDYDQSLRLRAYPYLMDCAIRDAMADGKQMLSLGPLNNEAKRRAGTDVLPLRAHLWNRRASDAWFVQQFFARQFQMYVGP